MKRIMVIAAMAASVLLVVAQPAWASWRQQNTPVPSGSVWQFSAVSCPAANNCEAVGTVDSSLLAESFQGLDWVIVSIADPGGAQLSGMSCTSVSSCEAVGQFSNGGTTQTLAEVWNGSSWAIQSTPNPGGATSSLLNDVSCRSASNCEAVGTFTSGGAAQTLAEVWNGSTWTIQSTPNGGQANSQLNGVSCTAVNRCEAVGSTNTGPSFSTLAEVWNGSTWAVQSTPNPTGSTVNELEGVSCSGKNCMATGRALAEQWNGTSWTLVTIAEPHGNTPADLSRVSCTGVRRCFAVGSFFDTGAIQQLVAEQWNGTNWRTVAAPISTVFDSSGLGDVSCGSPTSCVAVGFYHDPVDGNRTLAENWALRWQLRAPPAPSASIASGLNSVSCPNAGFCASVGGDEESGSVFNAFVDFWNGNAWRLGTVPNASNIVLSGISCKSKTACTAVGDVATGGGGFDTATLALRYDGTNWTVQTTPTPAGAIRAFLISVSCPTLTDCTAVGFSADGSGNQTPFAEQWNGTTWSLQTTPFPSGSTTSQINNVSCPKPAFCEAVASDNTSTWAEGWNGTSWAMQTTPAPSRDHSPHLSGVSCLSTTSCEAVGDVVNPTPREIPLTEAWNGTSWTPHTPFVPQGSASAFVSVSCATNQFHNSTCNAGGFVTRQGVSQPLGESGSGATWFVRSVDSPDPNVTRTTFSSLSCSTSESCMGVGFFDTSLGAEDPLGELFG